MALGWLEFLKDRMGAPAGVSMSADIAASKAFGVDLIRVEVIMQDKDIQKTGIICPRCYRPTDFVIWGVHK